MADNHPSWYHLENARFKIGREAVLDSLIGNSTVGDKNAFFALPPADIDVDRGKDLLDPDGYADLPGVEYIPCCPSGVFVALCWGNVTSGRLFSTSAVAKRA